MHGSMHLPWWAVKRGAPCCTRLVIQQASIIHSVFNKAGGLLADAGK
jgi:hypothetical protein